MHKNEFKVSQLGGNEKVQEKNWSHPPKNQTPHGSFFRTLYLSLLLFLLFLLLYWHRGTVISVFIQNTYMWTCTFLSVGCGVRQHCVYNFNEFVKNCWSFLNTDNPHLLPVQAKLSLVHCTSFTLYPLLFHPTVLSSSLPPPPPHQPFSVDQSFQVYKLYKAKRSWNSLLVLLKSLARPNGQAIWRRKRKNGYRTN